jgi:Flp pilus assembly protein TadG
MKRLDSINQKLFAVLRREQGLAVVEFAVLVPILVLIVFGIADFGLAMNAYNNQTQLANEGARYAAVNRIPSGSSLASYIKAQGDTDQIRTQSTVCVSLLGSNKVGQPVQVTVSLPFDWAVGSLPLVGTLPKPTIVGSAVMRMEQPAGSGIVGCTS